MARLRKRLAREEGFTLIELLVVIVIIGILLAIAVPSYLGFRDRANQRAASADVRAAVPAAEAYYADHGTYADVAASGATFDATYLKATYDSGMKLDSATPSADGKSYCLDKTVGDQKAHFSGPGGEVVEGSLCS